MAYRDLIETRPGEKADNRKQMLRGVFLAVGVAETLVIGVIILTAMFGSLSHSAELEGHNSTMLGYASEGSQTDYDDAFAAVFMGDQAAEDIWVGMKIQTIDGQHAGQISQLIVGDSGHVEIVAIDPDTDGGLSEAKVLDAAYIIVSEAGLIVDMTFNTLSAQVSSDVFFEGTN